MQWRLHSLQPELASYLLRDAHCRAWSFDNSTGGEYANLSFPPRRDRPAELLRITERSCMSCKRLVAMTRAACACPRECQKPRQDCRRSVKDLPHPERSQPHRRSGSHDIHASHSLLDTLWFVCSARNFSHNSHRTIKKSSRTPVNPANSLR